MARMATYYEILGVAQDADGHALKQAYRAAAKRLHPDAGTRSDAAMVRLNAAYDTLRDPGKRVAYDRANAPGKKLPPRPAVTDPALYKLRVLVPIDVGLRQAFKSLSVAVEELAYDFYDDDYVARFSDAVDAADVALRGAHWDLFSAPWPPELASGLNLYRQAVRQAEDAVADFQGFPLSYDTDLVVQGRDLLRLALRMLAEARAALRL